jgi:hypothetical protein
MGRVVFNNGQRFDTLFHVGKLANWAKTFEKGARFDVELTANSVTVTCGGSTVKLVNSRELQGDGRNALSFAHFAPVTLDAADCYTPFTVSPESTPAALTAAAKRAADDKCTDYAIAAALTDVLFAVKVLKDGAKDFAGAYDARHGNAEAEKGRAEFKQKTVPDMAKVLREARAVLAGSRLDVIGKGAATGATLAAVKLVSSHASTDPTREVINYVATYRDKVVATDGRRLVVLSGDFDGPLDVPVGNNPARPDLYDVKGAIATDAGTFPNWKQVIPEDYTKTAVVGVDAFISAVKSAQKMAGKRSVAVKLTMESGKPLTICASDPDVGGSNIECKAVYTGKPLAAAYNPEYLVDAAKVAKSIKSVTIELQFTDELTPLRIVDDAGKMLVVVMPMRLQ